MQLAYIDLPALNFGPIKRPIGHIIHQIKAASTLKVVATTDYKISTRRTVPCHTLSDGQTIIIVNKGVKIEHPNDIDGIIKVNDNGEYSWYSHKKLIEFSKVLEKKGWEKLSAEIESSWLGQFAFATETILENGTLLMSGLRPPQTGGLHAIGSHWSLSTLPATIVMPTGTGKTETMLAMMIAFQPGKILVVVPSKVLRDQTARKFVTLGLLRRLGNIPHNLHNPVVGVITKRPHTTKDLEIIKESNVIVTTMSALGDESVTYLMPDIANISQTLIVDEAHHIAAATWTKCKEAFAGKKVLQFTATPYRRDGKLVDGKVIYEYPLHLAQKDGYFKPIVFKGIYEIDPEQGDRQIAKEAVAQLRIDLASGLDHLVMARCADINRANEVIAYYKEIAAEFNPIIIHSEGDNVNVELEKVHKRESRIVVCVNMLGEGFDLPQLKIAGVHDTHKSLAILLQFTGRFTRSAAQNIGNATVIANTENKYVSAALERLYSEDADWNELLSEFSSKAAQKHSALIEFLSTSKRLDRADENEKVEISHNLLRPNFTTVVYEAETFDPKNFYEGLPKNFKVHAVWHHQETNTLYFVAREEPPLRWTRSKEIKDRIWSLFVLHFDETRKLLYLSSTDTSSTFESLGKSVGGLRVLSGDKIFRCLGGITRLIFQNVGVRKHGRRNLRFAMYTGSDVRQALGLTEKSGSIKSNLSGTGWEKGKPITIGCSIKGRVWARDPGSIPELIEWCEHIGSKLIDEKIDTSQIIENVLIPDEVTELPQKQILNIDWPLEILKQAEERVVFTKGDLHTPIYLLDINITKVNYAENEISFSLSTISSMLGEYQFKFDKDDGFKVTCISDGQVHISIGRLNVPVEEFFNSYPPLVRFVDLFELDGNLLIGPQNPQELQLPAKTFEVWDWTDVDITKESLWKKGIVRNDSIQAKAADHFIKGGFELVIDDDDAGEAADLVCMKEESDYIRLVLVHCKFSNTSDPGERVKDVVEVSSQAIRSAKWKWKFKDLCHHLIEREKRNSSGRPTRFLKGNNSELNKFSKISRIKEIRTEILIVQPGVSQSNLTKDQSMVLAAAYSYLKETIGIDLEIVCSN